MSRIRVPVSRPRLTLAEHQATARVMRSGQLTFGPTCIEFESALAKLLDIDHVVVTSSGTTAIHLALAAIGIGPSDEVLVPDLTFVATANAVSYCGATPVLIDVDPDTWCIDTTLLQSRITSRTRAIIPVSLYGVPCAMDAIRIIADGHGLAVIEDAAEGFGGTYADGPFVDRPIGTGSDAGTYSFYGNKIITTGEGGAVVTRNSSLATQLRHLRGQAMVANRRYYHDEVGFNYRMTELQAAIGLAQLTHFKSMRERRRAIIEHYAARLSHVVYSHPCVYRQAAPWLYTAEFITPVTSLASHLASHGIETRPVFVPLHRLPMWRNQGTDYDFPVASRMADRGLSLPTYAELSPQLVDEVCDLVTEFVSRRGVA